MMKIIFRTGLLAILVLLVVKAFFAKSSETAKPAQTTFGSCVSQVPREWGQFKGGSEQSGIAFEDARGTLRFITNLPCNGSVPPVALEVRRTATAN
jgi:hypothetical protein